MILGTYCIKIEFMMRRLWCAAPRRKNGRIVGAHVGGGPGLWRVLEGGKQFMAPRLVGIRCSPKHGWPGWRRWYGTGTGSYFYPFLSGIHAHGSEDWPVFCSDSFALCLQKKKFGLKLLKCLLQIWLCSRCPEVLLATMHISMSAC